MLHKSRKSEHPEKIGFGSHSFQDESPLYILESLVLATRCSQRLLRLEALHVSALARFLQQNLSQARSLVVEGRGVYV